MYILPLIDDLKLEAQAFFFKVTMLANFVLAMKPPLNYNPCSKMWALLMTNQIIYFKLLEWLKLVELSMAMVVGSMEDESMAMVVGSMEDERCFSNMFFMKNKLRSRLTTHLNIMVRMYT
jgi:hypothetical protein